MIEQHYLDDCLLQMRKLRSQAEKAIAQIDDEHLFATLDAESNSIALLMKHVAGNMRSRWTDFLTTDGEKPDRHRDSEFEQEAGETRAALLERWARSWDILEHALGALEPRDLEKTVTVRGEPHTVVQALGRQLTHYASHVGQIVLLSKHYAGPNWKTLSMPRRRARA